MVLLEGVIFRAFRALDMTLCKSASVEESCWRCCCIDGSLLPSCKELFSRVLTTLVMVAMTSVIRGLRLAVKIWEKSFADDSVGTALVTEIGRCIEKKDATWISNTDISRQLEVKDSCFSYREGEGAVLKELLASAPVCRSSWKSQLHLLQVSILVC